MPQRFRLLTEADVTSLLPLNDLNRIAERSGLQWVNSDADKIAAIIKKYPEVKINLAIETDCTYSHHTLNPILTYAQPSQT